MFCWVGVKGCLSWGSGEVHEVKENEVGTEVFVLSCAHPFYFLRIFLSRSPSLRSRNSDPGSVGRLFLPLPP